MKTQHTPGPWYVYSLSNGSVHVGTAHFWAGTHNVIADVMPLRMEKEANARLIAAAPELLEACKSMLDWMEFTIPRLGTTPTGSIERKNWGGPISKARDAIAKAEGTP